MIIDNYKFPPLGVINATEPSFYWFQKRDESKDEYTLFFGRPERHGFNLMVLSEFDTNKMKYLEFIEQALNEKLERERLNNYLKVDKDKKDILSKALKVYLGILDICKGTLGMNKDSKMSNEYDAVRELKDEISKIKTEI